MINQNSTTEDPEQRLPFIEGMCGGMFDGEMGEDEPLVVRREEGVPSFSSLFGESVAADGFSPGDDGPSG